MQANVLIQENGFNLVIGDKVKSKWNIKLVSNEPREL